MFQFMYINTKVIVDANLSWLKGLIKQLLLYIRKDLQVFFTLFKSSNNDNRCLGL